MNKQLAAPSVIQQFRRSLPLATCLLLVMLVLRFFAEGIVLDRQQQASEQVLHLQTEVSTLLSSMLDQETGLRGYIVTDDLQFLAPFQQGRAHYLRALQQLKADIATLPFADAREALIQVEQHASIWYSTFAQAQIHTMQAGDLTTPRSRGPAEQGKTLFDHFRQTVTHLQETLTGDLRVLEAQQRTFGQWVFLATLLFSLLVVLFLLAAFRRLARDLTLQLTSLQQVAHRFAAGELAAQVGTLKHVELHQIGQTLNHMAHTLHQQHEELATRALLIEQASEYWALLNTVNTALLFLSSERQVLVVNACFSHFFALPADEIIGQPSDVLFAHWQPLFADAAALQTCLDSQSKEEAASLSKTILVQVAPRYRELELQLLPVHAREEHFLGYLYLLRDVTQERELDRVKSEFIATVSHEFRTALTGIQGFSELICQEASNVEEAREFANDITADALRLTDIVSNLLDLEGMQSGTTLLHVEQGDLNALLKEVANLVQATSPLHSVRLELDDTLPPLPLDSEKIRCVILHLLSNAVKYSPAGGDIVISSRREETVVHICVQDQGIGIPVDALERVFSPYSRIHATNTRYVEGASLGLPLVRQIVQMHHGQVWAESLPGQGARLHITLPLQSLVSSVPSGTRGALFQAC